MDAGRRGFLTLGAAFVAAPAIVRVSALMPVSVAPNYAAVRGMLGWHPVYDADLVRYDVFFDGVQYGLSRSLGLGEKVNKRKDISFLFSEIERLSGRSISMAQLVRPKDPPGAQILN